MRAFKAVIFDMDGVIFDSEVLVKNLWVEMLPAYGVYDMEEQFAKCIGQTREKTKLLFFELYGEDFPYEEFRNKASQIFHERYDHGKLPLKPGVVELLDRLKAAGVKLALASSTRVESVRTELADAGLLAYFDAVIGGDMVDKSKPEPDIFLRAAAELGVQPKEAYIIEDSHYGVRAAAAAGSRGIMVPDLMPVTEEMKRLAECVLPSLVEVREYLFPEN